MKTTMIRQVIGAAFGNPLSYTTFSGYSRHFFLAMQQINGLASTVSSKQIMPQDVFSGCLNFSRLLDRHRPDISAYWLWNPATIDTFSRRFERKIARHPERLPVLQIGTHVYPVRTQRPFYCITDMTIKQAMLAGQFRIKHLTAAEVSMAIQAQKRMFDSYEKIFVLCEWARTSVIEDYDQPGGKVIVIGAGANMEPLEAAPQKYSSHEILFVGYDWVRKGGPLLLEALKLVRKRVGDAVLNIVGCQPAVSQEGVNVVGMLRKSSHEEMARLEELYRRANCFCLLPEFDPFPNVLLEAGITSTPVVSLRNGSRSDVVRNGITGILVEHANAAEVAEAIVYILSNPDTAQRMGQMGSKCINENYTWDSIVKKVLNHIFDMPGIERSCESDDVEVKYI